MRLCNNAILAAFLAVAVLTLSAQSAPAPQAGTQATPVPATGPHGGYRSGPFARRRNSGPSTGPLRKQGEGYLLHTDVEEVVLNATVLNGTNLVQNLTKDDFTGLRRRGQADAASASSTPIFPSPWGW